MAAPQNGTMEFARHIATEQGVYGLILVSGLIATASNPGAGSASTNSLRLFVLIVVTVSVFWLAHVYSNIVAGHGRADEAGDPRPLRHMIRHAVREARGMVVATVFPSAALLLGVFGVLPDRAANWLAMWVCVGALACLGYLAYQRLGVRLIARIGGALATASFGLIIIIAKAIVTH